MPHYVVTLDLRRGCKQTYDDLDGALTSLDCCRPFEAVLLVCTPWGAEQVRSHLARYLDRFDQLSVDQLAEGQSWSGWVRDEAVRAWLTRHLGAVF